MKKGHYFVALTGIFSGTIVFGGAVFAKMGLSLFQIAAFRMVFSLLFFFYLLYTKDLKISKRLAIIFLLFGFVEAMGVLTEFAPVVLGVPVSTTVLLLYTAPFWTVIFSRFLFKEKITILKLISLLMVMLGVLFLANPQSLAGGGMTGILIALAGGIFLSLWGVFGKICGNEESSPIKTQFYEVLFMFFFLMILYPIMASVIKDPSLIQFSFDLPMSVWAYLALFALISNIIPHLSYYHGVRETPASTAGIILLLEPVAGILLAALFLSQTITLNTFIGGVLILFANFLVIKYEPKDAAPELL